MLSCFESIEGCCCRVWLVVVNELCLVRVRSVVILLVCWLLNGCMYVFFVGGLG